MTATIIAVCNQKGGVGKTTTVFQLARANVRAGHRTLVVDLDPQGNLTTSAAGEGSVEADSPGMADALSHRSAEDLRGVIVPGVWDLLTVAPTVGEALGYVRDELTVASVGRESRVRSVLADVAGEYDLILIDCPPSLDQLAINALAAADVALIVVEASLYAADGLSKVLATIELVREHYNPRLRVGGVLANKIDERKVNERQWLAELRENVDARGLTMLEPAIPERVSIKEATEAGLGLDQYGTREASLIGDSYARHLAALKGII